MTYTVTGIFRHKDPKAALRHFSKDYNLATMSAAAMVAESDLRMAHGMDCEFESITVTQAGGEIVIEGKAAPV